MRCYFSPRAQSADTKLACYWASYGLVGFCARFYYSGSTPLCRGQRVLLRSHRGLEVGEVLWQEDEASSSHDRGASAPWSGGWPATGNIVRPLADDDPWWADHLRLVAEVLSWMQVFIQENGSDGVICDLEYIHQPDEVGVLYLGLAAPLLARLSLFLESQFHVSATWYDASELLEADRVWEDIRQARQATSVGGSGKSAVNGCAHCACGSTGSCQAAPRAVPGIPASGNGVSFSNTTAAQHVGMSCQNCIVRDWLQREARRSRNAS